MASLMLGRDPRLLELAGQADRRSRALRVTRGTGAAFVTDPDEPAVNAATIDYVEHFVPEHCCSSYEAHLSIGMARRRDLEASKPSRSSRSMYTPRPSPPTSSGTTGRLGANFGPGRPVVEHA